MHPQGTGSYAEGPVFWEVCIGAAEVRVDRATGQVKVTRTATIADSGRAINPQLVERQDEGATMQGIGNALFEEMVFEQGLLVNDDLLEYRIPNTNDLPGRSTCVIVENGDGPGPFGAKGCGEGAFAGIIGPSPAAGRGRRRAHDGAAHHAGARLEADQGDPAGIGTPTGTSGGSQMPTFKTAAVMGTGTMGPGMGAVLARAGYQVALYDTSIEALERAKAGYDLAWSVLDRLETPVSRAVRCATPATSRRAAASCWC